MMLSYPFWAPSRSPAFAWPHSVAFCWGVNAFDFFTISMNPRIAANHLLPFVLGSGCIPAPSL